MKRPRAAPEALDEDLRRRFRTVETAVRLGSKQVSILHPESAEELIDETEFERDERLPYWASLWPSSVVLATVVSRMAGAGNRLLELGCGSGLVATAAAVAGFSVCATDYYDEALRFTRRNVMVNTGAEPEVRLADWRAFPADLTGFDVVAAADVLYERTYGELVARAILSALGARGHALVADPGRLGRVEFLEVCARGGLAGEVNEIPYEEGPVKQRIALFDLRRV